MNASWITTLMFVSVSLLTLSVGDVDLRLAVSLSAGRARAAEGVVRRAGQPGNIAIQGHEATAEARNCRRI